jgi:hypothetical protein
MNDLDALRARAKALNLNGLLAHWPQAGCAEWVKELLDWEEQERARRSLERRLRAAHIGRFKPICEFDWGLAQTLRSRRHRSADVARLPQGGNQLHPGRPQWRR